MGFSHTLLSRFVWLALLLSLAACTLSPAARLDRQAMELGFSKRQVTGSGFEHVVFAPGVPVQGPLLHVYLEGDGSPWMNARQIAVDPTPRQPLMLTLMARDSAPRLYLGRPCYHGLASHPRCHPGLWTYGRYSQAVVDSMASVLNSLLEQAHYKGVVLLGHSGGGTLAMLLAERIPQTRAVVTLAANLDPDAWAAYHGYSPLWTSLNPAERPPLPEQIYQLHLIGRQDKTVPPELLAAALNGQHHADLWIIDQFDHRCCWVQLWPAVLAHLAGRIGEQ